MSASFSLVATCANRHRWVEIGRNADGRHRVAWFVRPLGKGYVTMEVDLPLDTADPEFGIVRDEGVRVSCRCGDRNVDLIRLIATYDAGRRGRVVYDNIALH